MEAPIFYLPQTITSYSSSGSAELNAGHCFTYIVFLKLLDGELCLHQVVVEDDDLSAQGTLFIIVVLWLIMTEQGFKDYFKVLSSV